MDKIQMILILISSLIIMSIFFTCCLTEDNNKDEKIEVKYEILIEPINNFDSNYIIICPIFINKNGESPPINDQFILEKGICEYNIKVTSRGYGLWISSNQSILLRLNQSIDMDSYNFFLSLYNTSKGYGWGNEYYIYYEGNTSDSLRIDINIIINEKNGDILLEIDEHLKYGWYEYNAKMDISGD